MNFTYSKDIFYITFERALGLYLEKKLTQLKIFMVFVLQGIGYFCQDVLTNSVKNINFSGVLPTNSRPGRYIHRQSNLRSEIMGSIPSIPGKTEFCVCQ